jgi:hypothetical protein
MTLSFDELQQLRKLDKEFTSHRLSNELKTRYYDGKFQPSIVGFSDPPALNIMAVRLGWAGTVVDTLEERLDFQGWNDPANLGLDKIYRENFLDSEAPLAHLDSLIYGTSFVAIGRGDTTVGDPDVLITAESPQTTTGLWNRRTRRLDAGITYIGSDDPLKPPQTAVMYLPDVTITLQRRGQGWIETDRDEHRLGYVPLVPVPNRTRGSRRLGRSEISRPVRDIIAEASRVLLSMSVHREFFSAPQRAALNVNPEDFEDNLDGWKAIMGHYMALSPPEPGDPEPKIMEFKGNSPLPYIEQLNALARQICTEAGLPESYFGIITSNPSSADAIRAGEQRLIKRAERRQAQFGHAWLHVASLALRIANNGPLPDGFDQVTCQWRDPSTPTVAATADAATKLVSVGILDPQSKVTMDMIGLTPAQQAQLAIDRAANPDALTQLVSGITPAS